MKVGETEFDNTSVVNSKELDKRNLWLLPNFISDKCNLLLIFKMTYCKRYNLRLERVKSIEHVKRYTTTGMATDQGKLSNMHALGIIADTAGVKMGTLGTTTFRPPFTPLTFGSIVGRSVGTPDTIRKTSIHEWHSQNNAKFENVGQWKRPWYYPINNEGLHEAVQRKVRY